MSDIKTVIVAPGRVAFTTIKAKEKFTSKPKTVVWNAYLEELLNVHHDIELVDHKSAPAANATNSGKTKVGYATSA